MSLGSLLEDTVLVLMERLAAMEYYPTPIIDLGVIVAQSDGVIEDEELARYSSSREGASLRPRRT